MVLPIRDYWIEKQLQDHFEVLYSIFPSQKSEYTHIYSVNLTDRYSKVCPYAGANININYKPNISSEEDTFETTERVYFRAGTCKRGKVKEFKFPVAYGSLTNLLYFEMTDQEVIYIVKPENQNFKYKPFISSEEVCKVVFDEEGTAHSMPTGKKKTRAYKVFDLNKLVKEGKAYKCILTEVPNGEKQVFVTSGEKSTFIPAGKGIPTVWYKYIQKDKKSENVAFYKLSGHNEALVGTYTALAEYIKSKTSENITVEAIKQKITRRLEKSTKSKKWETLKLSDFEIKLSEDQNFSDETVENEEVWKTDPKLNRKFLNNYSRHGEEPGKKWTSEEVAIYVLWLMARAHR